MITKKTTHAAEAVGHLVQQFRGKAKLEALVSLLGDQVQELENALFQVLSETALATCVGEQLDGWGRLLDVPRHDLLDTPYRLNLQAKVLVIRSRGTVEELIAVLDLLTGGGMTLELEEFPATDPASFVLNVTTALPAGTDGTVVARLALQAKPAAVRGIITSFDSDGIAFDDALSGFDDADDAFGTSVGD